MRQGLGHKCEVAGQGPFVLLNVCHLSNADHACVGCVVSYSNTDVTMPVAWTAAVVWGLRWRWLLAWKWSACNIYLLHVLCAQITILSSAITVWDTVQIATCPFTVTVRYCANHHLLIYCHCEILCKLPSVHLLSLWSAEQIATCPFTVTGRYCANRHLSIYCCCEILRKSPPVHLLSLGDTVQIATCPYTVAVRYCANRHLSIYCHCEILCKLTPCYLQILRMLLLVQLAVLWLTNSFCTCFVTCKLPPCHLPWLYMYVSCANDYPSIYSHCKTYILCTLP